MVFHVTNSGRSTSTAAAAAAAAAARFADDNDDDDDDDDVTRRLKRRPLDSRDEREEFGVDASVDAGVRELATDMDDGVDADDEPPDEAGAAGPGRGSSRFCRTRDTGSDERP
jgi:hypothetical protein